MTKEETANPGALPGKRSLKTKVCDGIGVFLTLYHRFTVHHNIPSLYFYNTSAVETPLEAFKQSFWSFRMVLNRQH